jgi:hypothetical protein
MSSVLIVEKNGTLKELKIKSNNSDEYYKKAGFKTSQNFELHHIYNITLNDIIYSISLYGKTKGKANQENKYEFPPPIDNVLFFGSCLLVNVDASSKSQHPLSLKEWEQIYEKLMGGFEDLETESVTDDGDDDDDEIDASLLTKSGYLKDDFIVSDEIIDDVSDEEEDQEEDEDDDDDEDQEEDENDDEDQEEDEEQDERFSSNKIKKKSVTTLKKIKKEKKSTLAVIPNKTSAHPLAKPSTKLLAKKIKKDVIKENSSNKDKNSTYLDCSSELTAEEYFRL